MSDTKTIMSANGFAYDMLQSGGGLFCAECSSPIDTGQYYAICSDCGGIFCEECVTSGRMDAHTCEDEDEDV